MDIARVQEVLAVNVRRLRKEKGLSQVALSRATGGFVSQATISTIEKISTVSVPGSDTIVSLATALQVEPWRLLVDPDSAVARLVDSLMSMDPSGRELIEKIIEREVATRKDR